MKFFFSFIHGNCLILYFIPLWQIFHSLFHYFILLWHVFHLLSNSCPGLFHSLSHSSVVSFSFIISFLCGMFFIHYLILALAYFIQYFIPLWQIFHSSSHSYPGAFWYIWSLMGSIWKVWLLFGSISTFGFQFCHIMASNTNKYKSTSLVGTSCYVSSSKKGSHQ